MDFQPRNDSAPDKNIPRFSVKPVQNNFKTEQEGRPVYEDREFVEIISPGLAKSIPVEEVNEDHKRRWPREYDAFKRGIEAPLEGTPLTEWPAISGATALNLQSMHIRTVEQLAAVDDGVLQHLGTGARGLREKAAAFLLAAQGGAPMSQMQAENDRLKDANTLLQAQLSEVMERLGALETKRGPGRPPKAPPETQEDDDEQAA